VNKEKFIKLLEKYNSKTLTHNEEQDFLSAIRSGKFRKLITKDVKYYGDSTILHPARIDENEPYIAIRITRKPVDHSREEKIKKVIWIALIALFVAMFVLMLISAQK
jgi:hypothetical protein